MTPPPVLPDPLTFLSGQSGYVNGFRSTTSALLRDGLADAASALRLERRRLGVATAAAPARRVLVLAVEQEGMPNVLGPALEELRRTRHHVEVATRATGGQGKFENLNSLLATHGLEAYDWLVVIDDDVVLPRGFLDRFLFLAERFGLSLAQPAHRARSHAAWKVTRRRLGSVLRETDYVEIGPLTAFHASTFEVLLPFPELRYGWGLDLHWAAQARLNGWRIGIVDAVPVAHRLRPVASAYPSDEAVAEAQRFLSDRPYVHAGEAESTLTVHRRW